MKLLLLTLLSAGMSLNVSAADPVAGKAAAATCAACHGPAGISPNPEWPNLAGQKEAYLANQLMAFKNGERKNALMSPMATSLSTEDMANIAAYYASLK